jgi:eukaryotic-like serine/threonine-protein kinase
MLCVDDEILTRYADGALEIDRIPAVDQHVDRCDACRQVVAEALASSTEDGTCRSDPGFAATDEASVVMPSHSPAGVEGRYRILRLLGRGGMGVVYEALDLRLQTRIALKTLRSFDGPMLLRLKNEFRSLADLRHPNLVQLGDLVHENDQWFFTMELVQGRDFLTHVRPTAGAFDEDRLRAALAQVADGLSALHRTHQVHRDVKPSNILVEADGRVVLLDFGLVVEMSNRDDAMDLRGGTPGYMAPEQRAGGAIGPAADWYAVGVMLYQSLTGRLPAADPPPPSACAAGVPGDLEALCLALLRRDPATRATAQDVRALSRRSATVGELLSAAVSSPATPAFVGRSAELTRLRAALAAADRRTVAVLIEGESGMGKTALVRCFAEEADGAGALVLAGRCHERESVPYNALDGIVDALSRHLGRLATEEREALLSFDLALLTDAFPVLLGIAEPPAPARATERPLDPVERRRRMYAALRVLLARLAQRGPPLVMVIDDLQWSDVDSLVLLADLVRPPQAPPLLLVGTFRAGTAITLPCTIERMTLGPLVLEDARELAQHHLRGRGEDESRALGLAEEAGRHPLFIAELARHAGGAGAALPGLPDLDKAIGARAALLADPPKALLDLLAVAAGPLAYETLAFATGQPAGEHAQNVALLRSEHLARTGGDAIETYHDRVRAAVLSRMTDPTRRICHERLALALEASVGPDAEALAAHWQGAGEPKRAAEHAITAADRAAGALAFERAARIYRMALELDPDRPDRSALSRRLAEALVNDGRQAEGAEVYLVAARDSVGTAALELKRHAAEHFLASSHVERGMPILDEVLAAVGVHRPCSGWRGVLNVVWLRIRLRVRGLGFHLRPLHEVPPAMLAKMDVCESAGFALSMTNPWSLLELQTRSFLLALAMGEAQRLAMAFGFEAIFSSLVGPRGRRHATELLATATRLAERVDRPLPRARVLIADALLAFHTGHWRHADETIERAERLLRDHCIGANHERRMARYWLISVWGFWGRIDALRSRLPERLREAEARGDLGDSIIFRTGVCSLAWLANDDPTGALVQVEIASAVAPQQTYYQRLELISRLAIASYCDDVGGLCQGLAKLRTHWPTMSKNGALRHPVYGVILTDLRGRTALAAAAHAEGAERQALVREAEKIARQLARRRLPWASPFAWAMRAGISLLKGQRQDAAAHWEAAVQGFEAADLPMNAAIAKQRLAELIGGTRGQVLRDAASTWFHAEGIRDPIRYARVFAGAIPPPMMGR